MNYIYVAFGGMLGSIARYSMYQLQMRLAWLSFPYATLSVNMLGSFLVGLLAMVLMGHLATAKPLRLLLMVGFCGGFTTFSSFALDTVDLVMKQQLFLALLNILLNVVLCCLALYVGMWIAGK